MSVKRFIENHRHDPLHFVANAYNPYLNIKDTSKMDLETLVDYCLELTFSFGSFNSDGEFETSYTRRRSAIDIWRHVIYFKPEITIYQVMNTLYKLRNNLNGKFVCHDINKRVFRSGKYFYNNDITPPSLLEKDEFGLSFYDWENISEETDK